MSHFMIPQAQDSQERALASIEAHLRYEAFFGTMSVSVSRGEEVASASGPLINTAEVDSAPGLGVIEEEVSRCTQCALHQTRNRVVFGVGHPNARLVLVGEAPGRHEDMQGEPFVGQAGALLTRMLARMGLTREEVYICNVLKCRPPQNRDPLPEEKISCSPFLRRQIEVIAPELILALGAHAARTLLGLEPTVSLGSLRGKTYDWEGTSLLATYHPAYLLRSPEMRWKAMDDLSIACKFLGIDIVERKNR